MGKYGKGREDFEKTKAGLFLRCKIRDYPVVEQCRWADNKISVPP